MKIIQRVTTLFMGLFLCVCNTYAGDAATKLNQDWKNINRAGCKSSDPDYYCSGVIAHVLDNESSTNHPWMPNHAGVAKGSISFSYLRQDIPVDNPLYVSDTTVGAGYIFAPTASLTRSQQFTLFCEYPINGATDLRVKGTKGCGPQQNNNLTDISTCKDIGVSTSDDYVKNINIEPKRMCSASPDQTGFAMMLDTIKKLKAEGPHYFFVNWNELVIQEWSNKKSKDIPIEAFFYEIINNTPKGKIAADSAAQSYHRVTGIDVPVVAVDVHKLASGDDAPFSNEAQ